MVRPLRHRRTMPYAAATHPRVRPPCAPPRRGPHAAAATPHRDARRPANASRRGCPSSDRRAPRCSSHPPRRSPMVPAVACIRPWPRRARWRQSRRPLRARHLSERHRRLVHPNRCRAWTSRLSERVAPWSEQFQSRRLSVRRWSSASHHGPACVPPPRRPSPGAWPLASPLRRRPARAAAPGAESSRPQLRRPCRPHTESAWCRRCSPYPAQRALRGRAGSPPQPVAELPTWTFLLLSWSGH